MTDDHRPLRYRPDPDAVIAFLSDGFATVAICAATILIAGLTGIGARTVWNDLTQPHVMVLGSSACDAPPRNGVPAASSPEQLRTILFALRVHAAESVTDDARTAADLSRFLRSEARIAATHPLHAIVIAPGKAQWGVELHLGQRAIPARLLLTWSATRWQVTGLCLGSPRPPATDTTQA